MASIKCVSPQKRINAPNSQNTVVRPYSSSCGWGTQGSASVTISSSVIPSVSIIATPASIITLGQLVAFTANPVNGGTTPSFQWSINGVIVGNSSPNYSTSTLLDGQIVSCHLTSNNPCANPLTAVSNSIIMKVGFPVNSEVIYMSDLIKVYPNPTSGIITIEGLPETKKSTIAIYSDNGKLIMKKSTYSKQEEVDISKQVSGYYLLIINKQSVKIIKK